MAEICQTQCLNVQNGYYNTNTPLCEGSHPNVPYTCTETSQCHRKVFKEIITCSYIFINLKCKVLLGLNSRTFTDLFYIDGLNKQSQ